MTDRRKKDAEWQVIPEGHEGAVAYDAAQLAVLMDIRDRLKAIEDLARCVNVRRGFVAMNKIRLHLEDVMPRKKKRRRKAGARKQ